jgi:glycolate oxidase subunit GlcD
MSEDTQGSATGAAAPAVQRQILPERLVADLREVVGRAGVITEPARLLVYESDGLMSYRLPPAAVAFPRSTAEVARTVRLLALEGLPFVPRGAGTGLSGGAIAPEGGVVISTARMTRILSLDPEDRRARVEPGVVNQDISRAAAPFGLHYAPDPSSQTVCTIGGNVAENAGGPHCLKYGVTSNHVVGLTVVLPDGSVMELGGEGGEPIGYDLVGTFVGSEGTFGIATEIEVRLLPRPAAVETLLAIFADLDDAARAVSAIIADGLLPAALEMIDGPAIRAVEASAYAAGYPTDAEAALVVELDGARAGLAEEAERAHQLCTANGARLVRRAANAMEREKLWQGRKKAFGTMGRLAPDLMLEDAVVPRTRLPDVLRRVAAIGSRHGLVVTNVFHAGDGNLHPVILYDRRDPDLQKHVRAAADEIIRVCLDAGGTITGEHGVGLDKRGYMSLLFSETVLSAMADVRSAFDPRGLANPGKVLPPSASAERRRARWRSGAASDASTADRVGEPRPETMSAGTRPIDRLRRIVGAQGLLPEREIHGRSIGTVVAPDTVEAVAAVLELASSEGWAVEPAGACGWLCAGNPPRRVDIVLSTSRLRDVAEYEAADLTASVAAGLTHGELAELFARHAQWLPQDPPGRERGTVGATTSTASAGPLRAGFGTPRDQTLGLQLVTGDGRVLDLGGRVVKNVAGYDLTRLVIGSRGTLGVVTRVNLRLHARPPADRTVALHVGSLDGVADAARAARESAEPCALEAISPELARDLGAGAGWLLLARFVGANARVEDAVAALGSTLGAAPTAVPEQAWRWLGELEASADVALRLAGRPSRLRATLARAVALQQRLRSAAGNDASAGRALMIHAQDGIVRLLADAPSPVSAWPRTIAEAREAELEAGGTLVVAQAPSWLAAELDAFGPVGPPIDLMRRLKSAFDPAGILSPGRFVV